MDILARGESDGVRLSLNRCAGELRAWRFRVDETACEHATSPGEGKGAYLAGKVPMIADGNHPESETPDPLALTILTDWKDFRKQFLFRMNLS